MPLVMRFLLLLNCVEISPLDSWLSTLVNRSSRYMRCHVYRMLLSRDVRSTRTRSANIPPPPQLSLQQLISICWAVGCAITVTPAIISDKEESRDRQRAGVTTWHGAACRRNPSLFSADDAYSGTVSQVDKEETANRSSAPYNKVYSLTGKKVTSRFHE